MGQLDIFCKTDDENLDKIKILEGTLNMLDNISWRSEDTGSANIFIKTLRISINNKYGPNGYNAKISFVKNIHLNCFHFDCFIIQSTHHDEYHDIYNTRSIDKGIEKMLKLLSK